MGNACSTAVMVTENKAEAVATPAPARLPLTKDFAALTRPEPVALCATRSLFDHAGGALVSTVLA